MIRVGVAGLGMMGSTHLDVYSQLDGVEVIAVADKDHARRSGAEQAGGNIEGQAQGGFDFSQVKQYEDAMHLIEDPDIDLVDICLTTPMHLKFASAALEAGKHVFIEKPLALNSSQAMVLADLADNSPGMAMCGMCMRFWPGWTWLKEAVDSGEYGQVLSAMFRRVAEHPGGPFYTDAKQCGGAILDLHIHDTDFVHHLFGMPSSVTSFGHKHVTEGIDHVVSRYEYTDIPMVMAEGGWSMASGFGFQMQYQVNFERATACFDISKESPLSLFEQGKQVRNIAIDSKMGYFFEIEYFLDCIVSGRPVDKVTLSDAARSIRIVEAEAESVRKQIPISLTKSEEVLEASFK